MDLRILVLSGIAVIGGGTAVTYGIIRSWYSTKNIAQRLKDEGFELLTSNSSSTTLDKVLKVYKTLSENAGKTLSTTDLLNMCNSTVEKDHNSNDDYKKSKRFCVVPRSVSSSPKLQGKTILKNEENNEEDKTDWESLKTKYTVQANSSKRIKGLDSLTGNGGEEWKALRNECKKLLEKDSTEEDYEDLVDKSLTWCIKDASGLKLAS